MAGESRSKEGGETLGFIGLGQMGYAMARRLRMNMSVLDTLVIFDVNQDSMKHFIEDIQAFEATEKFRPGSRKVRLAATASEVAQNSSVMITCLPSPTIVKSVFASILGCGDLPCLKQERLFIDCSTIDPSTSRATAEAVRKSFRAQFVDAPISGGVVAARAGTLTFMFGVDACSDALLERIKSVLSLMGKEIWHTGQQGTGLASKLANNYILSINNIATAEALNMGVRWGLDPRLLTELINSSTGRCWPTEVNNPVPGVIGGSPASNNYEAGGSVGIIHKDLKLAMAEAQHVGATTVLANEASKVYDAVDREYHGKDLLVVYKWLQDSSPT